LVSSVLVDFFLNEREEASGCRGFLLLLFVVGWEKSFGDNSKSGWRTTIRKRTSVAVDPDLAGLDLDESFRGERSGLHEERTTEGNYSPLKRCLVWDSDPYFLQEIDELSGSWSLSHDLDQKRENREGKKRNREFLLGIG
jgi:hypothetical protein